MQGGTQGKAEAVLWRKLVTLKPMVSQAQSGLTSLPQRLVHSVSRISSLQRKDPIRHRLQEIQGIGGHSFCNITQ